MPLGIVPARGEWEYRRSALTTSAQGQFQRGDLVGLDHARLASLMTSSNFTSYFGVATHDSLNSLPAGFATIAIPIPGCTAYLDVLSTEATSGLSFGQAGSIVSAGGRTSTFSLLAASQASQWVAIAGPVDSASSRIEVMFIQKSAVMYSVSSVTFGA
jgi:hypothetical protein